MGGKGHCSMVSPAVRADTETSKIFNMKDTISRTPVYDAAEMLDAML